VTLDALALLGGYCLAWLGIMGLSLIIGCCAARKSKRSMETCRINCDRLPVPDAYVDQRTRPHGKPPHKP
jgi:hypothetical protein